MQIGKTRHQKTCEDFGNIMNEDSRCLVRKHNVEENTKQYKEIPHQKKVALTRISGGHNVEATSEKSGNQGST